jgi:hypothetical protein
MAGTLDGQLWFINTGGPADATTGHVNSDGSNVVQEGAQAASDQSEAVGIDLAAGFYFTINHAAGTLQTRSISNPSVVISSVQIANPAGPGTGDDDLINALAVDPYTHTVYVGLWGQERLHTGIVEVSYNTTTGALDPNAAYGTGSVYDSNTPYLIQNQPNFTDARDFAIDHNGGFLYYTDDDNQYNIAPFSPTNGIYRVSLSGGAPVEITSNANVAGGFPTNQSLGIIGPLALDETRGLIYFETNHIGDSHATLWYVSSSASGALATQVTLPGGSALGFGDIPQGGISIDEQSQYIFITVQSGSNFNGPDEILQGQLSPDGHSITSWVNTYLLDPTLEGHTPGLNAHVADTAFDQLPVLTIGGTTTHAAEQGTDIDLTSAATTITDTDGDHLAGATVQITGGTFTANETSANDDHLFVLDGAAHRTSGLFTGTNITVSFDSASETLSLTGYDTLADYQTVLNAVHYNTTGDNPTDYGLNNTRTIHWTASDGAQDVPFGAENSQSTTITIDAVNDAPNIQVLGGNSASMSLTESNSGFNTSRSLTITDPDSLTETLSLTSFGHTGPVDGLSDTTLQGFFSVPSSVNITQNTGSASFNWTFNSGAQAFDYLAAGETLTLNYTIHDVDSNDSNAPSSTSLSDDQAIQVTIAGTNDAPIVTGGTSQALTAGTEDTAPAGQTVSSLLGSHFSDVDDNASLAAVAIVSGGTSASGTWQWSSDGSSWSNVGSASDATAVLVHAASSLRFLPAANFNGTAPSLSVRLVDDTQASFSDGATANVGTNGGTTPYSTGTVGLTESVGAVNDAPVVSGTTASLTAINEDSSNPSGQSVSALFASHFDDSADNQTASGGSSSNTFIGVAVTGNAATASQGVWQYSADSGANWTALSTSLSDSSAVELDTSALLRFVPAANFNGSAPSLSVRLIEDSNATVVSTGSTVDASTNGGTTSFSAGTIATSETITALNDAPVVVNGTTETLTAIDEDNTNPPGTLISSVYGGHFDDSTDNQTANGGSSANTLAGIAITANAATAAQGAWQWSTNGTTWNSIATTVSDTSALVLASSTQIRFLPAANYNGTAPSLTSHLIDSSAALTNNTTVNLTTTGTGGTTQYSTGTVALGETINAVNDAPVAAMTTDPYTATEQTALDLKNTGMSVSDVDALGAVETATLSVGEGTLHVDAGTSGAVVSNDNTSSVTITGTIAQINAALNTDLTSAVSYIDNTDNPSASTTLTLHIDDGGATGSGSALTGNDTSTINITAVNDAPVATITPTEYDGQPGTSIDLKNTLSVSDVDGNAGSETVTLSATSGTLSVTAGGSGAVVSNSGTKFVTITGTVAQINALLTTDATSTVSYVDSTGGTKTLTLVIDDNGNTGGGNQSSQDTALILLDQPPSLGGAANTVTYTEQQSPVAIDDQITLNDTDAPAVGNQINSATVKITVGALTGDLLDAVTTGTNITATFNGTDTLTLSGPDTIANYQQVLQSVTFASTSDDPTFGGTDTSRTVTWTVSDIFDVPSTPVTSTIDVTAVNDAPVAAITPASYSATEQTALDLKNTGLSVSDVDGDSATETATLSVTEGTLIVTAGGSGALVTNSGTSSVTISGTLAQINALLSTDGTSTVSYTDGSDNPAASATLLLEIDDGGATGGGALTGGDTATINITPVNDAPVATITPATYAATENAALSLKNNGLSVSDIDGNNGTETVTLSVTGGILNVTAGGSGATVTDSGTSSVTISGTLAEINALLNTDGTSSVDYVETNDNPPATETLTLAINDNGNTGGGALTGSDTATINITAVNDGPVATITPTSYGATENAALDLKNNGLSVSDVDGNAGTEEVTLSVGEGVLNVTAGGSGALVTNSGTSSVTITGTLAQINALLSTDATSTVSYVDNVDNPAASTTLALAINDNGNTGGGALSSSDTATINITPVNDAPVATITPATYSATENTTLSLKNNGLAVSDIDGNSGTETATLSVTGGILNVAAGTSGATVTDSGTSSVTISGTLAEINALLNTDGTSSVDYVETNDNPPATETLTLAIDDNGNTGGGALTGSDTATINITAVNDGPVATITPTSYGATENAALDLKNNGLSVSDSDGNSGSETVSLSVTEGTLNVSAGTSGATVTNSGTNLVTITGTIAQINALLNTDGSSTVSYIDNNDVPAASTTLTLLIHDNGNTGSGGDLSSSDAATINITPVNDAPLLSGLGDTPAFVENGAPVVLDTNSNASVSDAELDVSPNRYSGATLTLARNGGANPDDVFGSVGSLDLTQVNGNGENVTIDGGATFIGTYTQPGDGSISFSFNGNATAADVDSVMRQITYQNTSDNPPSSAQIDFTFSDGNGQPGGQSQGSGATPGTATGSITVSITQVDDPPQLVSVAPTAAYSPGSAGAVLSPALAVFDPDATPPSPVQGIHSGTVQIASGFLAGDELFVNLTSSGGHFVTPDGAPTNISASYAAGTLTLSGTDTVADYQTVLDAVSYRSTAADPSNGGADPNRTITWSVNDGVLNSQTPAPAVGNNPAVNETVLHFDVAPVVDLDSSSAGTGYTTTYTTSTPPIAIVNNDTITDPDTANADSLTAVLTNAQAGDALSIAGSLPGGISGSIDTSVAGQITVRLTNSASIADYQTALSQIRFANSNASPNLTDRNITVVLSESEGISSNTAQATVHVVDATPPAKPPAPDLTDATDSGVSHTDNITNVTAPTFTGTVEPGTTVRLYDSDGTTVIGTGAADAQTGAYTITSSALSQGTHHVTVTATDASNNTSVHSDTLDVMIDTTAPAPTLTAADATTTFRNSVVHYTLSFPETTFGVDAADFTLTQSGGAAGAAITGISEPGGAGTPYTITVSTGTGLGALQLSLNSTGTGITDTAGNAAGGATGPTYTVADRPPVAKIDRVTLGAAQNTLTGNVLSNDSDADGDALRVTSVSDYLNGVQQQVAVPASGTVTLPSTHGVFTIAADGSYSFSANDARPVQNHYAEDPLLYSISDGHGGTANSQLDVNFVGQQRPSTETFNFNFVNSTVTYGGDGQAYLTGPDGVTHNVTGVGLLIFNDGRINESDYTQTITVGAPPGRIVAAGSALVDDLYYDSQYHDVYLAGVDPEAHYAAFGWHEGRNPDPYFNTNYYLSQNPDVAAAGVNPLTHYDTFGWHEGRNPGPNFNTTDYELANPDVAAAGVDPLTHYLTFGELENRVIFPANAGSDGPVDGFDPAYYLANNPDVAAAHVDPLQHYLTFGWHEGRNPSADFNTNFYESHNPDVAAAGVDPLIHYDQSGWHEGRDPSAAFSTSGYLTTYTDVAAAGVNPLQHFLQFGMAEGRSPTG